MCVSHALKKKNKENVYKIIGRIEINSRKFYIFEKLNLFKYMKI